MLDADLPQCQLSSAGNDANPADLKPSSAGRASAGRRAAQSGRNQATDKALAVRSRRPPAAAKRAHRPLNSLAGGAGQPLTAGGGAPAADEGGAPPRLEEPMLAAFTTESNISPGMPQAAVGGRKGMLTPPALKRAGASMSRRQFSTAGRAGSIRLYSSSEVLFTATPLLSKRLKRRSTMSIYWMNRAMAGFS